MQKNDKMVYLNGDFLSPEDMIRRAKSHKADACILLTNKNSINSSEEDYRNILIALAVKKFVYDQKDSLEDAPPIPLCMQLIKPESKNLYFKSLNLSPLQDQLIIVEEIKMNLLAKSCFAPGLIAMVSNLITSGGDIDKEINPSEWFDEYADGMEMEIYAVPITNTDYPDNITFQKIAEVAYSEYGAIVFALEIRGTANTEFSQSSIIRLNPNKFVFKDWSSYSYLLHMICDSKNVAKLVQTLEMPSEKYERIFGAPKVKKEVIKNNKNLVEYQQPAPIELKKDEIEMQKIKSRRYKDSAIHTNEEEEEQRSLIKNYKADTDMAGLHIKRKKSNNMFDKKENVYSQDYNKSTTDLTKDIEEDIKNEYEYLPKPQTQMEVGEEHLLQKLKNHIVVCGIHSSIKHFILPLRAKYLQNQQQDIVIITPV